MTHEEKRLAKEISRRDAEMNRGYRAGYNFVNTLKSLLDAKTDQLRYEGKSEDYIGNFCNAVNDATLEW
jgi:hypothetical protein